MAIYETVFMARQELSVAQVEKLTADMLKIATDMGAKLLKKEDWGLRTLAYPVNKAKKAYYVLLEMETPAEALLEMERNMRYHDDVMRYMSIRRDCASTEQSPILNKERDDSRLDDLIGEAA